MDLYRLPHRTVGPGQRQQLQGTWLARELGLKTPRWALPGELIPGHISHNRLSRRRGIIRQLRPGLFNG